MATRPSIPSRKSFSLGLLAFAGVAPTACGKFVPATSAPSNGGVASLAPNDLAAPSLSTQSTAVASAIRAGWASQTGVQGATTPFQRRLVQTAWSMNGQSSGPSLTYTSTVLNPPPPRKWWTDFEAPSAILVAVNKAIGRYHAFRTLRQGGNSAQVVAAMKNDLGSLYDHALADWITQSYDARASAGRFVPPTDLQGVLNFLQIRKMCLEFVCDLVIRAGGTSKSYGEAGVSDPRLYRPGMGLYEPTVPHSMIILDIMWNASGLPERFQVAEANATPGNHWTNPVGMAPWLRTVQTGRTFLAATAPPYKVMDFETR